MKQREFGRTGLKVSELVFGGGRVGGLLIYADDATKRAAMALALERGINWVDTAPSYGDGKSEETLGWLLGECKPRPYLSTKVMLDPAALDDIPGQIERSLAASFKRLRVSSVDLVFLHNLIRERPTGAQVSVAHVLGARGVVDGFERMREQGMMRHIGITALGDTSAVTKVLASGRFDAAQVYYNMLNPSAGRAMPAAWTGQSLTGVIETCRRHKVGVMNIRVLAAGVLATEERHGREGLLTEGALLADEERKARAVFAALGDAYGTRSQTAIRFSLTNPDISCVAVGLAEMRHLEQALAAADAGPLPRAALDRLEALYARDFR